MCKLQEARALADIMLRPNIVKTYLSEQISCSKLIHHQYNIKKYNVALWVDLSGLEVFIQRQPHLLRHCLYRDICPIPNIVVPGALQMRTVVSVAAAIYPYSHVCCTFAVPLLVRTHLPDLQNCSYLCPAHRHGWTCCSCRSTHTVRCATQLLCH